MCVCIYKGANIDFGQRKYCHLCGRLYFVFMMWGKKKKKRMCQVDEAGLSQVVTAIPPSFASIQHRLVDRTDT